MSISNISNCVAIVVAISSACADAADWPQFRGPTGMGISDETELPLEWGPKKNIRWRVPLPDRGNSSPIVSRGHVFVTVAEDKGRKRTLICIDRRAGKTLWSRTVTYPDVERTHSTNPYCASTPCADGERVIVWHSSAGLHCYDFDGKRLWSRDLGKFVHIWGYGASPIIHRDAVVLNCGLVSRNSIHINPRAGQFRPSPRIGIPISYQSSFDFFASSDVARAILFVLEFLSASGAPRRNRKKFQKNLARCLTFVAIPSTLTLARANSGRRLVLEFLSVIPISWHLGRQVKLRSNKADECHGQFGLRTGRCHAGRTIRVQAARRRRFFLTKKNQMGGRVLCVSY